MTNEEAIIWLKNLKKDIGETHTSHLWHYEQALDEVIAILRNQPEWIPCSEDLPKEAGVYWVTVVNREWVGNDIVDGAEPRKTEGWNVRRNLYGQLPDGMWVTAEQRVYNPEIKVWSGYGEIVLAWMPLPEPYRKGK